MSAEGDMPDEDVVPPDVQATCDEFCEAVRWAPCSWCKNVLELTDQNEKFVMHVKEGKVHAVTCLECYEAEGEKHGPSA